MSPRSILSAQDLSELADLLFPDAATLPSLAALETQYPQRELPDGAMITRVAPSPTGFAHIGLIFMSLVNRRLAEQSRGVFILRIEDTDEKREVEGAFETIVHALMSYDLAPHEGFVRGLAGQLEQRGSYGPYLQSERRGIYRAVARHLVREGLAYPCFCGAEELEAFSAEQQARKMRSGYYGQWARWRDRSLAEIRAELEGGRPFVIRLRSPANPRDKVVWKDGVKGSVTMPANDLDSVLIKSDGQSLYHLAHLVDDHFMRVTHVIRGDEWVSSVPLHIQLYQLLGWEQPHFSHLATIQKLDTVSEVDPVTGKEEVRTSKRKLSKRKDPEANALYYLEKGFPPQGVVEYLLNLANSNFEDWRRANPLLPLGEFGVRIEKFSPSGALADTVKLTDICKTMISYWSAERMYEESVAWADRVDPSFAAILKKNPAYTKSCFGIERGGAKPSKRIATWFDVKVHYGFLFDEIFEVAWQGTPADSLFPAQVDPDLRKKILGLFVERYDAGLNKEQWFAGCKTLASELGFAPEMKLFKENPSQYRGHIGDLTMVLRVALAGSRESPDLYESMQVLGVERTKARLQRFA